MTSWVGIPVPGRSFEHADRLVGYCTHLLPIRSRIVESPTFSEHLTTMKNVLLDAYQHQDYPFARLLNHLHSTRSASFSPLVSTMFNLERPITVSKMADLKTELYSPPISFTPFDLSLNVIQIGDELLLELDYSADLFDQRHR